MESSTPELERWNLPAENRIRYLATVFGLVVMGMNDACLGALLPYVRYCSNRPPVPREMHQRTTCLPRSLARVC